MKNRILLLGLAVTLTISAEAAWSRSRFKVVPGVERKLKDEGLGELIIDVSKDGRYVTVDCSPDYKMTADWKYIDVRRKPGKPKGIICKVDTVQGIVKYKIPFDWSKLPGGLKKALFKYKNKKIIYVDFPLANFGCELYVDSHVVGNRKGGYKYTYTVTVGKKSKRKFSSIFLPSSLYKSCSDADCEIIKPHSDVSIQEPYSHYANSEFTKRLNPESSRGVLIQGGRRPNVFFIEPGGTSKYSLLSDYPPDIIKTQAFCYAGWKNNPAMIFIEGIVGHITSKMRGLFVAYALVPSRESSHLDTEGRISMIRKNIKVMKRTNWIDSHMQRILSSELRAMEHSLGDSEKVKRVVDRLRRLIESSKESMCSIECKSFLTIHLDLLKAG